MTRARTSLAVHPLEDRLVPAFGDVLHTVANPQPTSLDLYGYSVAADGNLAVVGARWDGGPANNVDFSGEAYVFNTSTGQQISTLFNPDPDDGDEFGFNVAVSGNLVVVGAVGDDANGQATNAGVAHLFNASNGQFLATFNNPSPGVGDRFGAAVAISGSRIVVGAFGDSPGGVASAGSAHIFDTTGTLLLTLTNPTPTENGFFGGSVRIFGNTVAVSGNGAVYFYNATTGDLIRTLNQRGALSDDGSKLVTLNALTQEISIIDVVKGSTIHTIPIPESTVGDGFGNSISFTATRLVIGASQADPDGVMDAGAAYVFDPVQGIYLGRLTAPMPAENDQFGQSVAIAGNRVVVGAQLADRDNVMNSGTALVFDISGSITLTNATVPEFQPAGTVVGTLTGPVGSTFTLVGGNGASGNSSFTIVGNQLRTASPLNFATRSVYSIRVRASVVNGPTFESTFTIRVTDDPNQPPPSPPPPTIPPPPAQGGGSGGTALVRDYAVGSANGQVRVFGPEGSERFSSQPFPGFTGEIRTAVADFNNDGVNDLVVGTGPGTGTAVRVIDGKTQAELFSIAPFEASFTGGVFVAAGDLTGDGIADLVITPDEGGGPRVLIFTGDGFAPLADFLGIDDPNFRGGARVAIGDLNGDGIGDLIVAAGFGGGPRVAVFDGRSVTTGSPVKLINDFFAFEETLRNGVYLTAGDVNGDGFADLILGGGPGGGPRVRIADGLSLIQGIAFGLPDTPSSAQLANFFAGDLNNRGGVRLTAKDLDGDALADLIVGASNGSGVTGYLGKSISPSEPPATFTNIESFPGFEGGVFVG